MRRHREVPPCTWEFEPFTSLYWCRYCSQKHFGNGAHQMALETSFQGSREEPDCFAYLTTAKVVLRIKPLTSRVFCCRQVTVVPVTRNWRDTARVLRASHLNLIAG